MEHKFNSEHLPRLLAEAREDGFQHDLLAHSGGSLYFYHHPDRLYDPKDLQVVRLINCEPAQASLYLIAVPDTGHKGTYVEHW